MNTWHESNTENHQGLIVDDETGRSVAVSYDKKDAKLIAAAPDLLEALRSEAEYYEVFALYGTATEEAREGHNKRARDIRQIIYNIEN